MYSAALVIAMGFGAGTAAERQADIATLKATLSQTPLPSPIIEPFVCDVAASEKWICTTLGLSALPSEATRIIKEGISIRLVKDNGEPGETIALLPTEGPHAYTTSDTGLLEALIHRRMVSFWYGIPASRRGTTPKLCQIGHVHPNVLQNAISELQQARRTIQLRPGVSRKLKAWVVAPHTHVGSKSVSQDRNTSRLLLDGWDGRPAAERSEYERIVEESVQKFNQRRG